MEKVTLASIERISLNFRLRDGKTVTDNYTEGSILNRACEKQFS